MKKRFLMKITEWRQLPESERLRLVARTTWIGGIAMIGVWMLLLLPFQLYINRGGSDANEAQVQGVTTQVTESPSPSPTNN